MSMRTRRKSKAAAAAAAELDAESVAPSEAGTAGQTRVEFYVPIPEDLDFDYLSRVFPDVSFDAPSPDSVLSLYRLVVTQAVGLENAHHDLEESRAENERKDVELDQALQDRESSVSSLETQVKGLQEELTKVKQDRDALASSKSNLESQISTMNSSQSVSSTELDSFKHRVEDTEREKRDLLSVVSRLKEDSAQRDEEIQTLRTSLKQSRPPNSNWIPSHNNCSSLKTRWTAPPRNSPKNLKTLLITVTRSMPLTLNYSLRTTR
ncbi:hypothetical protein EDB85DRAFT_841961 [Lactarius pseudohatsudake]|nr:hypothetical protein EDB85DRAFT_841961 [Lactarius pseudohatsudake]